MTYENTVVKVYRIKYSITLLTFLETNFFVQFSNQCSSPIDTRESENMDCFPIVFGNSVFNDVSVVHKCLSIHRPRRSKWISLKKQTRWRTVFKVKLIFSQSKKPFGIFSILINNLTVIFYDFFQKKKIDKKGRICGLLFLRQGLFLDITQQVQYWILKIYLELSLFPKVVHASQKCKDSRVRDRWALGNQSLSRSFWINSSLWMGSFWSGWVEKCSIIWQTSHLSFFSTGSWKS